MSISSFNLINAVISAIMLLSVSTFAYAKDKDERFNSPFFDITLNENIKLVAKTELNDKGFYRYIFASSSSNDANMQMRVIVSGKQPEKNQTLEAFQTNSVANMSVMFIDAYGLYQYLSTPANKKVMSEKPSQLKIGNTTFSGMTMYFGDIEASFLVTNSHSMKYSFMLISRDANEKTRKNNLKMLTEQLNSIKFN